MFTLVGALLVLIGIVNAIAFIVDRKRKRREASKVKLEFKKRDEDTQ